jgi:hypothetical protein
MSPRKTRMNPPSSTSSSSSKSSNPSAPSISKPLEESDNEDDTTSQQNEIEAQAERIANLELIIQELISNQAQQTSSSSNVTSAANRLTSVPNDVGVIDAAPVQIETRTVPKKNYLITSASVSKVFVANKINDTTTDSFIRINMIRGALTTAGLQYMLDGNRKKPN